MWLKYCDTTEFSYKMEGTQAWLKNEIEVVSEGGKRRRLFLDFNTKSDISLIVDYFSKVDGVTIEIGSSQACELFI